ncbi:MAG: hypothetical protein JOZ18_18535, partial [Chloroflexi bacterium]|nr:hypothetical protein [Chloroflexota bacterium]
MERATHPQARQTIAPDQTRSPRHLVLWVTLWIIGVIALAILAFMVHIHPKPWPGELNITNVIQGPHPVPCTYNPRTRSWLDFEVDFINSLNDPIQSVAIPVFWMVVLMIFRGFRQAIFLAIAVLTSSSMWA